jgi:esterase/lipase
MQKILLLHGAIGANEQFSALQQELADSFSVYSLNFSGQGGAPFSNTPFSIKLFATEVIAFLDENKQHLHFWIQHGRICSHIPGQILSGKRK